MGIKSYITFTHSITIFLKGCLINIDDAIEEEDRKLTNFSYAISDFFMLQIF